MQLSSEQRVSKLRTSFFRMPNTLSLQQCLTVCRHYESLSLHIQQIRSGADKQVEILRKRHPKVEETWFKLSRNRKVRIRSLRNRHCLLNRNPCWLNPKRNAMAVAVNYIRTDPKIVQHGVRCAGNAISCTIGKLFVGQVPKKSSQRRPSSMVSEIRNPTSISQTIPKQVFDIVDVANSVNNLSHNYKRQLELNTLTSQANTQSFSNIQINGVTVKGKQDTGAEICVMPLNIFDHLNSKLNGELKLCPCNDSPSHWVQQAGGWNCWQSHG